MSDDEDRFAQVQPPRWRQGVPFPDGHFYSPVTSREEIWPRREQIWDGTLENSGIDYAPEKQRRFIDEDLRRTLPLYDYPAQKVSETAFYDLNPAFSWLDSRALFTMLLKHRPQRFIEVGAGYSTLLTADVNARHFGGAMQFTSIEPYPMAFLAQPIPGFGTLLQRQVQDIPAAFFGELGENDILFIDSSHVSKTGSDVNHLVFNVLPSLKPGVLIHFHDIFLPRDYPPDWVFNEWRSWNEAYLLRALLIGSDMFAVEFGCAYAIYAFRELLREVLGGKAFGGGSIWLRKLR